MILIPQLTEQTKRKTYSHYMCQMLSLKHSSAIFDKTEKGFTMNGHSTPAFEKHNLMFYYLWKDLKIENYEDISDIKIYDWFKKFNNEIND